MSRVWQDLRFGARMLCRRPGTTFVLVLTLALGIGANSAIFSVVDAVLLRPLPYADSEQLVNLYEHNHARGFSRFSISIHNLSDWRSQSQAFEEMAAYNYQAANLTGGSEPRWVTFASVSANLFRLLEVTPVLGRAFLPDDDLEENRRIVVLAHDFWQQHFGGDAAIIGQPIRLHGTSYSVVGVMPASFGFPSPDVELWRPLPRDPALYPGDRSRHFASAVGRLKQGVTLERAQVEMDTIAARLAETYPNTNEGWGVGVESLHGSMVANSRAVLLILWAAVGLVLLIACSNVANILLAQAASKEKEVAVRSALGAGRLRIAAQAMTESALLALVSGAAAVILAIFGISWLPELAGDSLPRVHGVALDWRVLAFTALATGVTGILIGLIPALQASKVDLIGSLQHAGRSTAPGMRAWLRNLLAMGEVALALMLLIGAGLVIFSFVTLWRTDAGFDPQNLLTFRYSLPSEAYSSEEAVPAFHRQLVERIESLPEVESAAAIDHLPLAGDYENWSFSIEGRPVEKTAESTMVRRISPGYLRTLKVPLLRGRALTRFDSPGGENAMVISKAMASRFWPSQDPIDQHIRFFGPPTLRAISWRIVGVAEDVPSSDLDVVPKPIVYVPHDLWPFPPYSMSVAARTQTDPAAAAAGVRAQIRALDQDLPIFHLATMEEIRGGSVAQRRFGMLVLGIFAGVALVLAVIGIYGTVSYVVGQRTREIGIRMALGAHRRDILTMTVGQGLLLTAAGVLAGLVGAVALTRYLGSLLFGVGATDPSIFAVVSVLLLVVGLLASYIPARRAASVDPIAALHYE